VRQSWVVGEDGGRPATGAAGAVGGQVASRGTTAPVLDGAGPPCRPHLEARQSGPWARYHFGPVWYRSAS
jgi:hypothetical protein